MWTISYMFHTRDVFDHCVNIMIRSSFDESLVSLMSLTNGLALIMSSCIKSDSVIAMIQILAQAPRFLSHRPEYTVPPHDKPRCLD